MNDPIVKQAEWYNDIVLQMNGWAISCQILIVASRANKRVSYLFTLQPAFNDQSRDLVRFSGASNQIKSDRVRTLAYFMEIYFQIAVI